MSDIHPSAQTIADRAFSLLWDSVSDPNVRKEALRLFLIGLVERQKGDALTKRVRFVVDALAVGIVKAGGDWREMIRAIVGPPPRSPQFPTQPRDPIADLMDVVRGRR